MKAVAEVKNELETKKMMMRRIPKVNETSPITCRYVF